MPEPVEPAADRTSPPAGQARSAVASWLLAALVGAAAIFALGHDLAQEPHFADESAYLSQAYFADLLLDGKVHSAAWLTYPAIDLPPLPKYLIGLALRREGYPRPAQNAAYTWYMDIDYRVGTPAMLLAARWPTVLLGALGGMAVYGLGLMAGGRRVGLLASGLLVVNPLYRMLARRAMSDVQAEALILLALLTFLWAWRRVLLGASWTGPALAVLASGLLAGLATLAKLNGVLSLIIMAAWALLALVLPRVDRWRKLALVAAVPLVGAVAVVTFIILNPFVTARPKVVTGPPGVQRLARLGAFDRLRAIVDHRLAVPDDQQKLFPDNALRTAWDKASAVAVQGFGRFGPFGPAHSDSRVRFDRSQDWGACLWLPWVGLGLTWALKAGRDQLARGEPPTAWAVLVQTIMAIAVVTAFLPLAWDRYFLSLQAGSAILAAGAAVGLVDRLVGRFRSTRLGGQADVPGAEA